MKISEITELIDAEIINVEGDPTQYIRLFGGGWIAVSRVTLGGVYKLQKAYAEYVKPPTGEPATQSEPPTGEPATQSEPPTGVPSTYPELVAHLSKPGQDIINTLTPEKAHLWHMATGIAGEAGELLDAVKKHVIYNKELDWHNVVEELGDMEFYMEGLRQRLNIIREYTLSENFNKLHKSRYPNGYSDNAAQERADKRE
jgi:NTP pyrophosphatase (non-canonical NTP hydrolase)